MHASGQSVTISAYLHQLRPNSYPFSPYIIIIIKCKSQYKEMNEEPEPHHTKPPILPAPTKYIVYAASVCSSASLVGLIGTYAILKKDIGEQLGLDDRFLGLLDSVSFVGRILGYVWITFWPTHTPKRDYFFSCIITTLFLTLIPLAPAFSALSHSMLLIAMTVTGFSRAYILIPNMIMLQYFDARHESDRVLINFWAALSTMGDVLAIIFTSMLLYCGVSWQACFCCSTLVFFICTSVLILTANQINMQNNHSSTQSQPQIQPPIQPPIQQTYTSLQTISNFYRKAPNLLWLVQYSLISIMYYNLLMWFPYYFLKCGFQLQASVIAVMYPTFAMFSVGLLEYAVKRMPGWQDCIIPLMHGVNVGLYIVMLVLGAAPNYAYMYIVLVALSGTMQGGPYSSVTTAELRLRTTSNRQMLLAATTCKLTFQICTVGAMYLIGMLMEKSYRSFFWILVANTLATFLVHLWRTKRYGSVFGILRSKKERQREIQMKLIEKEQRME